MGALAALVVKDIKQLMRDPRSLLMILLMPTLVMLMFAAGYGEEGSQIPIAVVNLDEGSVSWRFLTALKEGGRFKIVEYARTREAGVELVRKGKVYAVLIIPEDFSKHVVEGKNTRIVTVLDAAYARISELVWQVAVVAVQGFMKEASEEYGTFNIEVIKETVYGPKIRNIDAFTAVVMSVLLHLVPMSLIAVSISRERERRTFEQLIMTPISSAHIILGKLLAYAIVTVSDMLVTLGISTVLLGVRVKGPFPDLVVVSLLILMCSLSIGLLISALSRNQLQAYQAAIFFFIPSMLFSGFFMPVEMLSPLTRHISELLPLYYFLRAFRNIQLRGWTLSDVTWECLMLTLQTTVVLAAAVKLLKLRVD